MQNKRKKLLCLRSIDYLRKPNSLELLKQDELKRLDFSKAEYEYFLNNCNFTERQKKILSLRRKGMSIIAISTAMYLSERTINREIKKIKNKILKEI